MLCLSVLVAHYQEALIFNTLQSCASWIPNTMHGVCSVDAGVAGVGVAGATTVDSLTTWMAGAGIDAAGAILPMLDVSGLTASG